MSEPKKLVVVDDDDLICEALQVKLSDLGYHVEILYDGQDLLQNYALGRYDAILMDTQMKKSIGYEICAELRQLDPKIIIIGMSADSSYHAQWMDAGATSFLPKMRLNRDLQETLQQYLNR